MKHISLAFLALTLTACGSLSMTRETPVMKKQGDFSPGVGVLFAESPYHGALVRDGRKGQAAFGAFRYGITDDIEVQAAGAFMFLSASDLELRGKWRWFHQGNKMVASSIYYFSDDYAPQANGQSYITRGYGISTSAGLQYNPALVAYAGGKINDLKLHYTDRYGSHVDRTFGGMSWAAFGGVTYQYFLGGVPFETDFMLTLASMPKGIGEDASRIYPMGTISLWYRH